MNTWTKEITSQLPAPSRTGRVVGGLRLGVLVAMTVACVGLFLVGRLATRVLGPRVTFQYWIARHWSRACLWLAGLRLHVHGAPIQRGALVANHSSWLDILSLRATRLIYFVSKAEVANWPGVGFITRITGTVFIERRRTEAKRQEAILRERIGQDELLCLFPEGTSTDGLRVLPFKSSLFSAFFPDGHGSEIVIQPVSVRYRVRDGSGLPADMYGWWGTMGFESHIWDVLTLSHGGCVDVVFHEPMTASDFEDRKTLADECFRRTSLGFETLEQQGFAADKPPAGQGAA